VKRVVDFVTWLRRVIANVIEQLHRLLLTMARYMVDGFGAAVLEGFGRRLHFSENALFPQPAEDLLQLVIGKVGVEGWPAIERIIEIAGI
jgi:hypothetical protein